MTHRAIVALGAALSVVSAPAVVNTASAGAAPLPDFCVAPGVGDNICTVRLASVTADTVNGTITGAPSGGGAAITLAGYGDAYLQSTGFGATPPDAIAEWDATIEQTNSLSTDPSDPNWYGNAKAQAFLPRTLNDIATRFPADVLVVTFTPDESSQAPYKLVSIQPTAS